MYNHGFPIYELDWTTFSPRRVQKIEGKCVKYEGETKLKKKEEKRILKSIQLDSVPSVSVQSKLR